MSLEVTKIEVRKFEKDSLKAFVNITFNGELTIDGFKLMDGENGLWLASPSVKRKDSWSNVVRLTKELQKDLVAKVKDELDKSGSESSSGSGYSRRR